ncbi:MAG: hypothetical protein K2H18_07560, partial [Muribaculaceae bacterium]|nr:hypothetical protein [Muribaculaceae bacterium]
MHSDINFTTSNVGTFPETSALKYKYNRTHRGTSLQPPVKLFTKIGRTGVRPYIVDTILIVQ